MPTRTCVGCRATAEKRELVRLVRAGSGFAVDAPQTAPGRGAYLHPACGERALRSRAIQRGLHAPVRDSEQLAALVGSIGAADA